MYRSQVIHNQYRIKVSPVENAVEDKADDDDTAIETGNETSKVTRLKEHARKCELTPLHEVFRQSQPQGCLSLGS